MKKFQNDIMYLVVLTIMVSCHQTDYKHEYFKEFNQKTEMRGQLLEEFALEKCYNPEYINVYDTILIMTQPKRESGVFSFYSLKTHELLASFGKQGKGPGEFLQPSIPKVDKENGLLWFIDFPKAKFYAFKISEILNNPIEIKPVKEIEFDGASLMPVFDYTILKNNNIMLASGLERGLCSIINSKGEVIKVLGEQPFFSDNKDLPRFAYSYLYSKFVVANDQNEVVFSYFFYDKLLKYNIETNEISILTGPDRIEQKANVTPQGTLYTTTSTAKGYFFTIRSTEKKIFALYLGRNQINEDFSVNLPHNIYVFNWDLKPIVNLEFNSNIRAFDLNSDGDLLYVINESSENNIQVYSMK